MHSWGDEFPYFNDVGKAAYEIGEFCVRWGRIRVTQTKEKYGTARVYCGFGWTQLGSIFSPNTGYYGNWPWYLKWVWRVYIPRWVNRIIFPYQTWIYRLAYKRSIKKYPHIKKEIIYGADWDEFLWGIL